MNCFYIIIKYNKITPNRWLTKVIKPEKYNLKSALALYHK